MFAHMPLQALCGAFVRFPLQEVPHGHGPFQRGVRLAELNAFRQDLGHGGPGAGNGRDAEERGFQRRKAKAFVNAREEQGPCALYDMSEIAVAQPARKRTRSLIIGSALSS